jgi:hypothetical protein
MMDKLQDFPQEVREGAGFWRTPRRLTFEFVAIKWFAGFITGLMAGVVLGHWL